MNRIFRSVGFALAAFGLFACNQPDKIAAPSNGKPGLQGKGSAKVRLPTVPADFLAKSGAGSKAVALFSLSIYGDGMSPIYQSWYLNPGQPQDVYIGDIPAGNRVFYGRLIRLDSAWGDTLVTHEGQDSAWIERDSITDVSLYLRKINGGGGTAHICVEVEGWDPDPNCIKPPIPIPQLPWFGGCWNLSITKPGAVPRLDSVFKAKLRIEQWDSTVMATVTWNSGATDSAYGYVTTGGGIYIGYTGFASFSMKGYRDTTFVDTTGPIELQGEFVNKPRGIWGHATGSRAPCDTVVVTPLDSAYSCWKVWQSLTNGAMHTGMLTLKRTDSATWGSFQWAGFPEMRVTNGNLPSLGSTLYLYTDLAPGMASVPDGVTHHAHYKARVGTGSLDNGAIYSTWMPGEFTSGDLFGKWGGTPVPCVDPVR